MVAEHESKRKLRYGLHAVQRVTHQQRLVTCLLQPQLAYEREPPSDISNASLHDVLAIGDALSDSINNALCVHAFSSWTHLMRAHIDAGGGIG